MRSALDRYSDIRGQAAAPYYHHATCLELRQHFERKGWDWDSYFKFAFVRNPWDRALSQYLYLKRRTESGRNGWRLPIRPLSGFPAWCEQSPSEYSSVELEQGFHRLAPEGRARRATREKALNQLKHLKAVWNDQWSWLAEPGGGLLVDSVGRYEALEEDFAAICQLIGIRAGLPVLNTTAHGHYRDHYSEAAQRVVGERFQRDVRAFGYAF